MEVKGILDKIRQKESEKKEHFFALEIDVGVVKSAVWLVEGKTIKVISVGESESWEEEKELLEAVDASLTSAAERFAPEKEEAGRRFGRDLTFLTLSVEVVEYGFAVVDFVNHVVNCAHYDVRVHMFVIGH